MLPNKNAGHKTFNACARPHHQSSLLQMARPAVATELDLHLHGKMGREWSTHFQEFLGIITHSTLSDCAAEFLIPKQGVECRGFLNTLVMFSWQGCTCRASLQRCASILHRVHSSRQHFHSPQTPQVSQAPQKLYWTISQLTFSNAKSETSKCCRDQYMHRWCE